MEAFVFVLTLATITIEACLKVATEKDRIPLQEAILDSTRAEGGFHEAHVEPATILHYSGHVEYAIRLPGQDRQVSVLKKRD